MFTDAVYVFSNIAIYHYKFPFNNALVALHKFLYFMFSYLFISNYVLNLPVVSPLTNSKFNFHIFDFPKFLSVNDF